MAEKIKNGTYFEINAFYFFSLAWPSPFPQPLIKAYEFKATHLLFFLCQKQRLGFKGSS